MKQKYVEYLKCDLTDAEIADAARELARANNRKGSIESQKKEVDAQLKAEIAAQESVISRLSALIESGHEYRNIDCRVELDTPEPGRKTVVRLDTGEIVNVKPMTDADRQMVIDLQTEAEAAEEKAREEAIKAEQEKVIVTPPPVLTALPEPEVMSAEDQTTTMQAPLPEGTWTPDRRDTDIGAHPAQKRKRGKDAAAGE